MSTKCFHQIRRCGRKPYCYSWSKPSKNLLRKRSSSRHVFTNFPNTDLPLFSYQWLCTTCFDFLKCNAQIWYIVYLYFENSWKHVVNSIKGEEFVVTLPISVKSMWRSNFGIVMENDISSQDSFPEDISSPTPKLLALHHPLDDFTRIVAKQSRKRSSSSHSFTIP